ncbi:hypothetical protein N9413_10725, partial [Paracoccaceae bacterium]|nr:hypothetical protein [Paracoccaceae bacterium]
AIDNDCVRAHDAHEFSIDLRSQPMPLLRLTKVRAQRAHRRNFLDHVRKQILSGWGLLFFKRKGSLCMNEEAFVDDYVKAFAEHIQCDPELAQELYFKHKVTEALDNEQKASVRRELSALQLVSNNLDRAAKAFNGLSLQDDHLRNTLRIQGLDLQKQIEDLNKSLKDDIAFFKASIAEGTSGTASDHKANKVAEFVASVFLEIDRPVSFGTTANDSGEPSTPFGKAVRAALAIFKVYRGPTAPHLTPEIAHWKRPAERAAKGCQEPN